MFIYGKTVAHAIGVMSYLAGNSSSRAGSEEISAARGISRALTAKLLTQLASAGFVSGQPGPGGGYTLAKPAHEISLMDIARLFEQTALSSLCPLGRKWCIGKKPCPLHNTFQKMIVDNRRFMEDTRLSLFTESQQFDCT